MTSTAFELTTDRFETVTVGPHFINARCFGEDFALWLRRELATRGIDASEPGQEDWGWTLVVRYRGSNFTLGIGVMDESVGSIPADWRIDVEYEKFINGFRSWFRQPPRELLLELSGVVEEVLRSGEGIRDVRPAE